MPQRAARETITALAAEAGLDSSNGTTSEVAAASVHAAPPRRGARRNPQQKPMEQMLWDAACSIRGEKDAPQVQGLSATPALPEAAFRRFSTTRLRVCLKDYGDRGTALEIAEGDHSLLRFYLPPEARWGAISGREAIEWPLGRKGPEHQAQGYWRALDQGGARGGQNRTPCCPA